MDRRRRGLGVDQVGPRDNRLMIDGGRKFDGRKCPRKKQGAGQRKEARQKSNPNRARVHPAPGAVEHDPTHTESQKSSHRYLL